MAKGFKKDGKFVPTGKVTGYNVKLKKKDVIRNPKHVTLKNGRKAIKGVGSDGTVMFKFVPMS